MVRYMCLVSGQTFDDKEDAEAHTHNTHNLKLADAIHTNEIVVELADDDDPEEVYEQEIERR